MQNPTGTIGGILFLYPYYRDTNSQTGAVMCFTGSFVVYLSKL